MEEKKIYDKDDIKFYLEEYDLNENKVILRIQNDSPYAIGITSNMSRIYIRNTTVEHNSEVYTTCAVFPEPFCLQNNIKNSTNEISGTIQFLDGKMTTKDFTVKLKEN